MYITKETIEDYRMYLINGEKAEATVEKYIRDVTAFSCWIHERELKKAEVLKYKSMLTKKYALTSVNSMLSSLNGFFIYTGQDEFRVETLKIQRRIFAEDGMELIKEEYKKLLTAAENRKSKRLYFLMQTICSTGIRVSELRHITVEAVVRGRADILCKGRCRTVLLPDGLCAMLKRYIKDQKIKSGSVFVTKRGNPLDRSNIWGDMKKLCEDAGVSEKKVFPHNLRHLFAHTYYTMQKDIIRLADILGHANVDTTRIYTMESGDTHRKQIQKLGLLIN